MVRDSRLSHLENDSSFQKLKNELEGHHNNGKIRNF